MRRVVDFGQMLEIEMRVDLRRSDTGVAKHFLHRTQITRRLQYMRSKRVAPVSYTHLTLPTSDLV